MQEPRNSTGPRRAAGVLLAQRPPGSIAPDHPPKQNQAWVITIIIPILNKESC